MAEVRHVHAYIELGVAMKMMQEASRTLHNLGEDALFDDDLADVIADVDIEKLRLRLSTVEDEMTRIFERMTPLAGLNP